MGGGVTGITLARELSKSPFLEIDLIEKSSALGGFHRNFIINDLQYDIGTFTFHERHNLFKSFPSIVNLYQPVTNKFGSVTGKNSLDSYPCTFKGYLSNQGITSFLYTCVQILYSKLRYWKKNSVPAFVKYYIGANAYEKTGLKHYIERLYQVADQDIDIQFATKRLSFISNTGSLRRILSKALEGQKNVLTPPVNKSALVRPKEGFKKIYSTLHELLVSDGVEVKVNCEIKAIKHKEQKFEIEFPEGNKIYDEVISTIPIPIVSRLIGKPLKKELESMNLLTLFYRFNGDMGHNYSVLHNFTQESAWKRITIFSQYYGKHNGDDYFSVEITLDKDSEPNIAQQQQQFESHLKSLGLFTGELKLQGSLITKNAYPVYLKSNYDDIITAKNQLTDWGLRLAGRQGEFDYLSSSDATANAVRVAQEIKQLYQNEAKQSDQLVTV